MNTPATRVLVGDKAKLTADEIEKVKESIKAVNPGSTVVVDDKGNATVTTPEGKTATIPAAQLVKMLKMLQLRTMVKTSMLTSKKKQ